jgi:putative nucleotidyltransferase with HDIG domain
VTLRHRAFLISLAALTLALVLVVLLALPQRVSPGALAAAAAVALAGAWVAAHLAARQLARPVRRIADATVEMARTGVLRDDFRGAGSRVQEVRDLESALGQLVESIHRSQTDRERSYVEAVGAVVAAVDARDQETSGHSVRVARYALALARAMGIEDVERLRAIEWGSLLHDVGKIAVPDAILRKVGPLTEEEWHIMRQHASWGYEILADVQFLRSALDIVYGHHERWDGTGYPRGLSGERIPLAARIFAVVDTYDAITSERPYRRAHSHREAIDEVRRVTGTQLDPRAVDAFLSIPEVELRRLRAQTTRPDLAPPAGQPIALPRHRLFGA